MAVAVGRVAMAVAASELDGEALAHKHRSIFMEGSRLVSQR